MATETTGKQKHGAANERRRNAFSIWVDALRLRASMRGLELDRLTADEWNEYDTPTVPFK